MKPRFYILALVAGIALGAFAHAVKAAPLAAPSVCIAGQSKVVTRAKIADALPAIQSAVSANFARFWGVDATIKASCSRGDWPITVTDEDAPCDLFGCVLGYHGVRGGHPYAVIFAPETIALVHNWTTTFTHELFEMLADPWINRAVRARSRFWLVEVSDPVAGWWFSQQSATGKRVKVSDFVTPAWYSPGSTGPFDVARKLSAPLELDRFAGYASFWDESISGWVTSFGDRRP